MVLVTAGASEVLSAGQEQSAAAKVRAAAAVGGVMPMATCVVGEGLLVAMNEEREASVREASVEAVQGELRAVLEDAVELEDSRVILAEDLNKAV